MVPLPEQSQLLRVEIIGAYDVGLGLPASVGAHLLGNLPVFIAQHRPAVYPANGRKRQHTAHAATVLEHDAIPVAFLGVNNSSLSQIREAAEVAFQDHVLLPLPLQVLRAVANLAAMAAWRIDMRDQQGIVRTVMLDDTGSLQQSPFVLLALEVMAQRAFHHAFQVASQLAHLARSEENIRRAVVVEEQRSVMEVAQARMNGPGTLGLRSGKDVGVAHGTALVRSQQSPELPVVILQRGRPLAATIYRSLLHIVFGRVRQPVEDVAHGLPVLQVLRLHDGSARHQVHRSADHIESVADADNVGVGHIGPQHRVLNHLSHCAARQQDGQQCGKESLFHHYNYCC